MRAADREWTVWTGTPRPGSRLVRQLKTPEPWDGQLPPGLRDEGYYTPLVGCPFCGREDVPLRQDGRLENHGTHTRRIAGTKQCPGSWTDRMTGKRWAKPTPPAQQRTPAPRLITPPPPVGRCPHGRTSARVCPRCAAESRTE